MSLPGFRRGFCAVPMEMEMSTDDRSGANVDVPSCCSVLLSDCVLSINT